MSKTFTCALCHGTFTSGWSEEEALAELLDNFGESPIDDSLVEVCDDCYARMMPRGEQA